MSKYLERAKELRASTTKHYNCAQSVFMPFAEDYGIASDDAFKITANFGSGMKMGATCGAITGGLMALGLFGIDDIAEYYNKLKSNHSNCLNCYELLQLNKQSGMPKKQHCDNMVFECVELVENILKQQGKI